MSLWVMVWDARFFTAGDARFFTAWDTRFFTVGYAPSANYCGGDDQAKNNSSRKSGDMWHGSSVGET